ncbi:hypothetical protein V6N12_020525 [Hibiscus sabdariffa]|uniref:Uncharacterized protein n=1 Tax=Hibiscus sabdariffa TaxID=183260 RepID=A0ABR2CYD1_9ROSI
MFLDPEEKLGQSLNTSLIDIFKAFMFEVGLMDIPLQRGKYSWSNNRDPSTFVRLDKFLISAEFEIAFPDIFQRLLEKLISNHNAILLSKLCIDWGPKPFRCFNFWYKDEGFNDTVTNSLLVLKQKNPNIRIGGLIRGSKLALKKWYGNSVRGTRKPIAILEKEISEVKQRLQCGNYAPELPLLLVNLKANLWKEYRREESSWLQKSRLK